MGKRSDFKRVRRDFYRTPAKEVWPITPFLRSAGVRTFAEPFVGDGAIVQALEDLGYVCTFSCDVEPVGPAIPYAEVQSALDIADLSADVIVTNPPWPGARRNGEPTVGFIKHLVQFAPTWMLLSADFMHNVYASDLVWFQCDLIVSVGRVRWIEGTKNSGKDNAAWFRFVDDKPLGVLPGFVPLQRPLFKITCEGSVEDMI